MEPLALALAAFGALGASALPSLFIIRKRSSALLERLLENGALRPRTNGRRLSADAVTAFGAVRVDVTPGVLGNRWQLTVALPSYRAEERAHLYPRLEQRLFGALGSVDLGPPKTGLPKLSPDHDRDELRAAFAEALPELARGSYPVIARGEAAWLVRLVLHPAADRAFADEVVKAIAGFHVTPAAKQAGFDGVLELLQRGGTLDAGAREDALSGLLLALEVRFHLSRIAQLSWSLSSCTLGSSALSLIAHDRGVALGEEIERRLEAFASLGNLLQRSRDSGGLERFPCPSCRMVFLDPPAGELAERECTRCGGRLLDRDAVRRVVLEPLGKTPGDLSEAARGAKGDGSVCPSCARAMAPVLLSDDVIIDLCVGCGASWLDEGELARLSQGRFCG